MSLSEEAFFNPSDRDHQPKKFSPPTLDMTSSRSPAVLKPSSLQCRLVSGSGSGVKTPTKKLPSYSMTPSPRGFAISYCRSPRTPPAFRLPKQTYKPAATMRRQVMRKEGKSEPRARSPRQEERRFPSDVEE